MRAKHEHLPMRKNGSKSFANPLEKAWEFYYKADFDQALLLFEEACSDDGSHEALFGRACTLFRTLDHEQAIIELTKLIKMDPAYLPYLHTRAMVYGADEQYEKATRDLQRVLEVEDGNVEAWCDLGGVHILREEYASARACFDKAADIDKTCYCSWLGKGVVALWLNEYSKAKEYLNIAIKFEKKEILAHMARAETFFRLNNKKEAIRDVKTALSLDSDFAARLKLFLEETDPDQRENDSDERGSGSDDYGKEAF